MNGEFKQSLGVGAVVAAILMLFAFALLPFTGTGLYILIPGPSVLGWFGAPSLHDSGGILALAAGVLVDFAMYATAIALGVMIFHRNQS